MLIIVLGFLLNKPEASTSNTQPEPKKNLPAMSVGDEPVPSNQVLPEPDGKGR